MNRVMSNQRLKIYIRSNKYLREILDSSNSAKELEARLEKTSCFSSICLVDINWTELYTTLKGDCV